MNIEERIWSNVFIISQNIWCKNFINISYDVRCNVGDNVLRNVRQNVCRNVADKVRHQYKSIK